MTNAAIRRMFILFVAALVVLAMGVPALAQDSAQEQQDEEGESTEEARPVLEEIVVTAQKRSQNLIDVPVSVTAIGEDELALLTIGGPAVRFLSGRVPSVNNAGKASPREIAKMSKEQMRDYLKQVSI